MNFNKIDTENWNRKQHFEHYLKNVKCGFSITSNIDSTALVPAVKVKSLRFYPVLLYMVTTVVNMQQELRTCFNDDKQLGYWEAMNPSYTVFHKDTHTFSSLWTEYTDDFNEFYQNIQGDMEKYANNNDLFPKPDCPPNCVPISCIPWTSFTGFNLNLFDDNQFLLPIVTIGKYFAQGNTLQLPVCLQIHHAVADGYHAAQFMNHLQQLASMPEKWLK
ncbi:type A chloramphenicol O-acetyltransferase [Anaerospora sp.]|uniref:type A chloramphenicol O-acetyltransferase n=1 Tax=Anaerospora sp. TaxID=1960278 RepID=UPI00289D2BFD|nr:type A chloramphenicol O-acetyltransferase [Anaerospora sp.]